MLRDGRAPSSSTRSTRSCATSAAATSRSRSSGSRRWPAGPVQRIGLSATQKPLEDVGALPRRRRAASARSSTRAPSASSTSAIEVPPSPLADRLLARAVGGDLRAHGRARPRAPHDARLREHAQDGRAHRGAAHASCSARTRSRATTAASRATRRLDAEQRLKAGTLRALVATASLELGHRHRRRGPRDPGRRDALDRDAPPARRPRRARARAHARRDASSRSRSTSSWRRPRSCACVRERDARPHAACRRGRSTSSPSRSSPPASPRRGTRSGSSTRCAAPGPTATSTREEFDAVVALHTDGPPRAPPPRRRRTAGCAPRGARASPRSLSGGAIPDTADYQVRLEPEGTLVGTRQRGLGDRVERRRHLPARQRVLARSCASSRASCASPTRRASRRRLPFWLGEAPGPHARARRPRSATLREECAARGGRGGRLRCAASAATRCRAGAAVQIAEYVEAGRSARSAPCPTQQPRRSSSASSTRAAACSSSCTRRSARASTAPGASRCASASASASASSSRRRPTRRRSCSRSARSTASRSRRSSTTCIRRPRATCSSRRCSPRRCSRRAGAGTRSARSCSSASRNGKRVPAPLLRMRADDLLAAAFPQVARLPRDAAAAAPIAVPMDHPIVRQTIEDCLTEAMDVDGFLEVLRGLRDGSIERRAVDTRRALGVRARDPHRAALHVPRRRAARGAAHAGGARRAACSTRSAPTSSARSIPTRSRACARRRGRSPRTPRRCTRRSSGWAT